MAFAAAALTLHLAAGTGPSTRAIAHAVQTEQVAAPSTASAPAPAPASAPLWPDFDPRGAKQPRGEFDAALLVALGKPLTPGLALRGRLRVVAGLWAHAGVSARVGEAPLAGGVREIPFELGLAYRIGLGDHVTVGVRGEALLMSRRMTVQNAAARHRWLSGLRGGVEARTLLTKDFGVTLLIGAEGRLGRTEVNVPGMGSTAFSPVAPYFELGPSLSF